MSLKRKTTVYPPELKLEAVHAFLDRGLSRREVIERYNITSTSTLKKWVIAYRRGGAGALVKSPSECAAHAVRSKPPTFNTLDPEEGYRIRRENLRLVGKLRS